MSTCGYSYKRYAISIQHSTLFCFHFPLLILRSQKKRTTIRHPPYFPKTDIPTAPAYLNKSPSILPFFS